MNVLSVDLGRLVAFSISDLKKTQNTKTGLVVTDRSDQYLAWNHVYLNLISYIYISMIADKLQSINSYWQLKYGL